MYHVKNFIHLSFIYTLKKHTEEQVGQVQGLKFQLIHFPNAPTHEIDFSSKLVIQVLIYSIVLILLKGLLHILGER